MVEGYRSAWQTWTFASPPQQSPMIVEGGGETKENRPRKRMDSDNLSSSSQDARLRMQKQRIGMRISISTLASESKVEAEELAAYERGERTLSTGALHRVDSALKRRHHSPK